MRSAALTIIRRARLACVLCAASQAAWSQPQTRLAAAVATAPDPFTRISGVRELADGRVLVADAGESRVVMLSPQLANAVALGRTGRGPAEYLRPGPIFAFRGDSSLLVDDGNSRLAILGPSGNVARTARVDVGAGGFVFPAAVLGTDRSGNVYYAGSRANPRTLDRRDSIPVIRAALERRATDTLAWVMIPVSPVAVNSDGNQRTLSRGRSDPWAPRDAWVVAPDGRVAVVRSDPYRVQWYSARGSVITGPELPVERIAVTAADAAAVAARIASAPRSGFGQSSDDVVGSGAAASARPADTPPSPFKPPFSWRDVLLAPNGTVWIPLSRRAGDDTQVYDVIDAAGKPAARVTVGVRARVVGFGARGVYVATADDDDLQHLSRHAFPP